MAADADSEAAGEGERGASPTPTGLLEREREVAGLDDFVSAIGRPGERIGLIEGPAGIGKTTLLAEARRIAESDGIRVIGARGSELEREFPFGVVRQLLEPLLASSPEGAFDGAAASARPVFEADVASEGAVADAGFATLHGLYWLSLNLLGDVPTLIALDDLHWCDRPSLRFISYLGRRLGETPVLIAATLRPNEPGADELLLAELAGDPLSATIRPGALSRRAVAELIERRLESPAEEPFASACHVATGGNPLLVQELLKAFAAEGVAPVAANARLIGDVGPRAASRAVLLRLARLPAEAASVARAVAVLGDGAELGAVARLAGLDPKVAAEATGALAGVEILRPEPPLGFVHPLVRDAVYLELPPGERELEHARAAELLRDAGAPAEQVAAQLLHTPRTGVEWAADVLERAGRSAAAKGAAESAVAYLRRAIAEPLDAERRGRLLDELGHAEMHTRGKDAAAHLAEAYESITEPRKRAETAFSLARTLNFTRRVDEANVIATRALAELPEELPDIRDALEAMRLMTVVFGAGERSALRRLEELYERPVGQGPGAKMLAAVAAFHWANTGGSAEQCSRLARAALEGEDLLRIDNDNGLFWVSANVVLVYADDPSALEVWEAARRESHRSGSLFGILSVNLWRGYTLLRWGELPEAELSLLAGAEQMNLWGSEAGTVNEFPAAFLCETRIERGDLAGARAALASPGPYDVRGDGANFIRGASAELLLAEGRAEEALEAAEAYREYLHEHANPSPHPWRTLKAVCLDRLGRTDEAIELARAELRVARAFGSPGALGRALRVLGELEREAGLGHLEQAVAALEPSRSRLQLAKALCALGTATRLARRPTEAREPLRRALELADVCGAAPLVERARAELAASGARPRREALTGPASLTPSERRVADLAAAGRTNREIAQELYVTPKTVEVHLSNAYRKLEIKGRRELAAALEPA